MAQHLGARHARELPETDEELVAVWGRILHLLKVEEKRLHGYL